MGENAQASLRLTDEARTIARFHLRDLQISPPLGNVGRTAKYTQKRGGKLAAFKMDIYEFSCVI